MRVVQRAESEAQDGIVEDLGASVCISCLPCDLSSPCWRPPFPRPSARHTASQPASGSDNGSQERRPMSRLCATCNQCHQQQQQPVPSDVRRTKLKIWLTSDLTRPDFCMTSLPAPDSYSHHRGQLSHATLRNHTGCRTTVPHPHTTTGLMNNSPTHKVYSCHLAHSLVSVVIAPTSLTSRVRLLISPCPLAHLHVEEKRRRSPAGWPRAGKGLHWFHAWARGRAFPIKRNPASLFPISVPPR